MMRTLHAASAAVLVGAIVFGGAAACATATGDVSGGEARFDPGTSPPAALGEGGTLPACEIDAVPGAPTTWTSLFTDYFGPAGQASCSKEAGGCHGGPTDPGASTSQFVCAADKDACRLSLLGASNAVRMPDDQGAPQGSLLYTTLRHYKPNGAKTGTMPKRPDICFSPAALDRISAWIASGAPND